jgi:hypothetical protein
MPSPLKDAMRGLDKVSEREGGETQMVTESLYLGAYALSRGASLKRVVVSRSNGRTTAAFELEAPEADELASDFYQRRAVVNLAEYREHLEALKDQLFGALRRSENENETQRRKTHDEDRPSRARRHHAGR